MSYKLLVDGVIVDAVAIPVFVRYNKRLGLFLACDEKDAEGLASHDGETYWHLAGRNEFPVNGYQTVVMEEISFEDATAIIEAMDEGKELPELEEPEEVIEEAISDGSLELVQQKVIQEMSAACNEAICSGTDIVLSDGQSHHFSYTIEDQLNLLSLRADISACGDEFFYHADGEAYRYFSKEDFLTIVDQLNQWRIYHVTYFSNLREYILSLETIRELTAVEYGIEVSEKGDAE